MGQLQHGKFRVPQYLTTDGRVRFDYLKLFCGKGSFLLQDGVWNTDLADVMHGCGQTNIIHLLFGPPCSFGQMGAVETDSPDMPAGFFVSRFECRQEPDDGFFLGLPDQTGLFLAIGV